MLFVPKVKYYGCVDCSNIQDMQRAIIDEPMLFGADLNYTRNNCGPLTKLFLKQIEALWVPTDMNVVVDTRSTMIMKGHYNSIPGWHCDDWKRTNGQPDNKLLDPRVRHYMMLLSSGEGDIAGTEFITNAREYNYDKDRVWYSLNKLVEADSEKKVRTLENNTIISFGQQDIHRATPAKYNGWRFFIRLSISHRKPTNQIRTQVQTYVDMENIGW